MNEPTINSKSVRFPRWLALGIGLLFATGFLPVDRLRADAGDYGERPRIDRATFSRHVQLMRLDDEMTQLATACFEVFETDRDSLESAWTTFNKWVDGLTPSTYDADDRELTLEIEDRFLASLEAWLESVARTEAEYWNCLRATVGDEEGILSAERDWRRARMFKTIAASGEIPFGADVDLLRQLEEHGLLAQLRIQQPDAIATLELRIDKLLSRFELYFEGSSKVDCAIRQRMKDRFGQVGFDGEAIPLIAAEYVDHWAERVVILLEIRQTNIQFADLVASWTEVSDASDEEFFSYVLPRLFPSMYPRSEEEDIVNAIVRRSARFEHEAQQAILAEVKEFETARRQLKGEINRQYESLIGAETARRKTLHNAMLFLKQDSKWPDDRFVEESIEFTRIVDQWKNRCDRFVLRLKEIESQSIRDNDNE